MRSWLDRTVFRARYHLCTDLRTSRDVPLTPPFIIAGIYRSGTTLVASLLERLGVDLGPQEHRCQGIGPLAFLNPHGFQENFLMNDLGRFILHYLGGSGVSFPDLALVLNLDLRSLDDADFAYYSARVLHDVRVSDRVRESVLRQYSVSNLDQYFCDHFDTSCWGFKDVHSGIYMPAYARMWPDATWVCIFREPSSFLESARRLSAEVAPRLWVEYYRRVMQFEHRVDIHWVAYEDLMSCDEATLYELISLVKGHTDGMDILANLLQVIDPSAVHRRGSTLEGLGEASELYRELRRKCASSTVRSVPCDGPLPW